MALTSTPVNVKQHWTQVLQQRVLVCSWRNGFVLTEQLWCISAMAHYRLIDRACQSLLVQLFVFWPHSWPFSCKCSSGRISDSWFESHPEHLQTSLSKLITYCVLRPTQPPTLSGTGSDQQDDGRVVDWGGDMSACCTTASKLPLARLWSTAELVCECCCSSYCRYS